MSPYCTTQHNWLCTDFCLYLTLQCWLALNRIKPGCWCRAIYPHNLWDRLLDRDRRIEHPRRTQSFWFQILFHESFRKVEGLQYRESQKIYTLRRSWPTIVFAIHCNGIVAVERIKVTFFVCRELHNVRAHDDKVSQDASVAEAQLAQALNVSCLFCGSFFWTSLLRHSIILRHRFPTLLEACTLFIKIKWRSYPLT